MTTPEANPAVQTASSASHKTMFARVAAGVTIVGSVLVIIGFFSPWLEYRQIVPVGNVQLTGLSLAVLPFRNGTQVTLESFLECTMVLLPLIFANFLLALGVTALFRTVALGVQSLLLACAVIEFFIVNSITFYFSIFSLGFLTTKVYALPLIMMLLGSLVMIVGCALACKISLMGALRSSERRFTTPAIFCLLGGVLYSLRFFLPAYPNQSIWAVISDLTSSKPIQAFWIFEFTYSLLVPCIVAGITLGIGITLIFRKPNAVLLSLSIIPVLLGQNLSVTELNPSMGSMLVAIFQNRNEALNRLPGFGPAFGIVQSVVSYTLILAGAVALGLLYYRDHRSQPAQ